MRKIFIWAVAIILVLSLSGGALTVMGTSESDSTPDIRVIASVSSDCGQSFAMVYELSEAGG